MISWFLLLVFFALSLRCFAWGVKKSERLYQFPTLFGAAWLFYMVPQALGAVNNPDKFPPGVLQDGGLETSLLMCIACVQAGWSGYHSKWWFKSGGFGALKPVVFSDQRILGAGVALYAMGFYANYLLASLAGGFVKQFSAGGHYALEWSGLPVAYVFFGQFIYPGLLFVCLALFHRPTVFRGAVFLLFSLYPIATTVFLGRRSMTAYLLLIVFLSLFFIRRWAPPKSIVFAGFLAIALFVVIAPQYRTVTQYGLNLEQLKEIQVENSIDDIISGKSYVEYDALVVSSALMNAEGLYGLGTNFYNATIAQLVPRQLVGQEFKSSLTFNLWGEAASTERRYYWVTPYGSNPTGVANAFAEFWFFGALIYYFGGVVVRHLWQNALCRTNHGAQIWYVMISLLVPISVIGSLYIIPGQLLTLYFFITPMLIYARVRHPNVSEASS